MVLSALWVYLPAQGSMAGDMVKKLVSSAIFYSAYATDKRTNTIQWILFSLLCLYIVYLYWVFGEEFRDWDVMPLTVWPFFFVAVLLSNGLHDRFARSIVQLEAQGALRLKERPLAVILRYLRWRAVHYSGLVGLSVVVFNLIAMALSGELSLDFGSTWTIEVYTEDGDRVERALTTAQVVLERFTLFFVMILAGYLAGLKLGLAVSYGIFLSALHRTGIALRLLPGHPDKASGLRPIGQFISYQSILATIPAFWLAMWILLIPHTRNQGMLPDYTGWLPGFTSTLSLAILISLLSFFLPLRTLNRRMRGLRDEIVRDVRPQYRDKIRSLYAGADGPDGNEVDVLSERATERASLQARLHDIENTPVWPLDPLGVVRFLAIVFVTFFIPIIQTYEQYVEEEGALQFFFIFFNALKAFLDLVI